ncbi:MULTISPECIES: diguanylate cyclase [unclassified Sulfurimonas]|uniref:diguanylate cyclase n=1 Tax=unclassified Sulfurimonas TaxID=2623549 RepID=UPI0025D5318B|nr:MULTISPECIES: diguanylate cyclase [unclassified Sulfurimonas]
MNYINSELLPLYEISCDNVLLLEKIVNDINSAVSAKEPEWINYSDKNADKIRENLKNNRSKKYNKDIKETTEAFNEYYKTVGDVSKKIIENDYRYYNIDSDTKILVNNYNKVDTLLKNLKSKTKKDIENNINSLSDNTRFILLNGNLVFFIWFLVSIVIILLVYKDIEHKIKRIVNDSKDIARGDVDFEKRLCIVSYDELGQIIKSINIFINKLHKSHKELSRAKEKLDSLYIIDRLTNVYNRIKIDEIIDAELKKQKRYDFVFSVILIDIDYFKQINDTYGHLVGDVVLKEFASVLKNNIRDVDFLGRWGGEEFIILCIQTDQNGALALAEHLKVKIEEFDFTKVGNKTASFGVATCTQNDNAKSIVENADKALYMAKNGGRNMVVSYN